MTEPKSLTLGRPSKANANGRKVVSAPRTMSDRATGP